MLKVGNFVKCKSFPIRVNGIDRSFDPNITVNKYYKILDIGFNGVNHNSKLPEGLYMLCIEGEKGKCNYWSDYFYTEKELRIDKLNKLEIIKNNI